MESVKKRDRFASLIIASISITLLRIATGSRAEALLRKQAVAYTSEMDKFAKEKARSRDKVLRAGAYPKGIDIGKDDDFSDNDAAGKTDGRAIELDPDTVKALLHTQNLGFVQRRPFAPISKGKRKEFIKALKDAGFKHEQIRQAYFIMRAGVVLPGSWHRITRSQ